MKDDLSKFIQTISNGSIKYSDPRKLDLNLIDKKVRGTIKSINSSNIVWTLWSCQGHRDKKGSTLPYITFVVKNSHIKDFLDLIFLSLPKYNSKIFPVTPNYYFTINRGYSNKKFTIISIHWCANYLNKIKNVNLYSDLSFISKEIRKIK